MGVVGCAVDVGWGVWMHGQTYMTRSHSSSHAQKLRYEMRKTRSRKLTHPTPPPVHTHIYTLLHDMHTHTHTSRYEIEKVRKPRTHPEVDRGALRVRQDAVVQKLEEDVEDVGVRLLHLA